MASIEMGSSEVYHPIRSPKNEHGQGHVVAIEKCAHLYLSKLHNIQKLAAYRNSFAIKHFSQPKHIIITFIELSSATLSKTDPNTHV